MSFLWLKRIPVDKGHTVFAVALSLSLIAWTFEPTSAAHSTSFTSANGFTQRPSGRLDKKGGLWRSWLGQQLSCLRALTSSNTQETNFKETTQEPVFKIVSYETASGRSPIEDFINNLQTQDQARFAEVFYGIVTDGLNYSKVQFRSLKGKLWEIKFNGPNGQYRIVYVMAESGVMIWLHAFKKKTNKIPESDLTIGEKRMKEVLEL